MGGKATRRAHRIFTLLCTRRGISFISSGVEVSTDPRLTSQPFAFFTAVKSSEPGCKSARLREDGWDAHPKPWGCKQLPQPSPGAACCQSHLVQHYSSPLVLGSPIPQGQELPKAVAPQGSSGGLIPNTSTIHHRWSQTAAGPEVTYHCRLDQPAHSLPSRQHFSRFPA